MVKLQNQGLKIVDKMYRLNFFYNQTIKQYQTSLYTFEATILYAMYLLSTTNFKQYAQAIIKNTSKIIEQVLILQSNSSSETYLFKASMKRQHLAYTKDNLQQLKTVGNASSSQKPKFKIYIDNVSNNLCKLLRVERQQLINLDLHQLVPNSLREIYNKYLAQLLNFQDQQLSSIFPYAQILTPTKIPIKMPSNLLVMGLISLRISIHFLKGIQIAGIIKKIKNKSICALVNFDGTLEEKEQGFNEQILRHSEVRRYLQIMKARWKQEKIIRQQQFNVMMNAVNYFVMISSPLSHLFLATGATLPPLTIEITNESSTKNRYNVGSQHENVVHEIKNIQNAINYDSQSSSSSKKRTAAINILSTFSEKNTDPIYRKIILGFVFVITCCLVVSLVGFTATNLQWDNTGITNNPLNDTINFIKMQHLSTMMLSNLMDIQQYYSNPNLNKTQVQLYFGDKFSYNEAIHELFEDKFKQFKEVLYKCLRSPSQVLKDQLDKRLQTQTTVYNMSVTPSPINLQQQNNTFQQILINYLIDFNLMKKGVIDNSITLLLTFTQDVIQKFENAQFAEIIDNSINQSDNRNRLIVVCMAILIIVFIVPMFFFFKSRLPMHQRIFDLFASVQVDMVTKQIQSLAYISNIIKNYSESSQILKNNLLQYEENNIYPKRQSSRRSFSSNQIVLGLEKFDKAQQLLIFQQDEQKKILKDKKLPLNKTKIRKSFEQNYDSLKDLVQKKKKIQKRKRAGDLDLVGSESDPQSRINCKHAVLYLMTLSFLIFLSLQGVSTNNYANNMKQKKNKLFNFTDIYISAELNFLLAKIYFRNGDAGLSTIDPAYRLQYLQYIVQATPTYDFVNNYPYDAQYSNCNSTDKRTVCLYSYSYLTLIGQFGNLIKQLFEARFTADQNYNNYVLKNQTAIYNQIIANISQKVFYMQTLSNQLEHIVYKITDQIYREMQDYSKSVYDYKLMVFVGSACWWILTVIVGTIFILGMKEQYFKEVYMLTFLNDQMIVNNKRVESFIESINKSSSI